MKGETDSAVSVAWNPRSNVGDLLEENQQQVTSSWWSEATLEESRFESFWFLIMFAPTNSWTLARCPVIESFSLSTTLVLKIMVFWRHLISPLSFHHQPRLSALSSKELKYWDWLLQSWNHGFRHAWRDSNHRRDRLCEILASVWFETTGKRRSGIKLQQLRDYFESTLERQSRHVLCLRIQKPRDEGSTRITADSLLHVLVRMKLEVNVKRTRKTKRLRLLPVSINYH